MKTLILSLAIPFFALTAQASVQAEVLAQHVMHVAYAPEEMRGTYTFRILANGVVETIDNHGKVELMTTLAPASMKNFKVLLGKVKVAPLTHPDLPVCMDAPSEEINVSLSENLSTTIWEREGCVTSESADPAANQVAHFVTHLQTAFDLLDF